MILTKFFDACHQWPMGLSSSFAAVINCSSWPMSSKPFVSWFSCRWHGHKAVKKMAISMAAAIEKLRLFADQGGFSLVMSVDSDTHRVNSPGTPWRQSLASYALRDDSSLLLRTPMAWALCPPSTPVRFVDRGFFLSGCAMADNVGLVVYLVARLVVRPVPIKRPGFA